MTTGSPSRERWTSHSIASTPSVDRVIERRERVLGTQLRSTAMRDDADVVE